MSLEKIQELRSSLVNLDKELSLFISGEPSPEEAGEGLAALNGLKKDIALVYDSFSHALS